MVHDKVIALLKQHGPGLPVEIGKAIGYDSFLTKAILGELINQGVIEKSRRPIGGSLIYYASEHVNQMRERLKSDLNIPEKKVLDTLKDKGQVLMSELTPHERAVIKKLVDFFSVEKRDDDFLITHYEYKPDRKPVPQPKPVVEEQRVEEQKPQAPVIEPVKPENKLFKAESEELTRFDQQAQQVLKRMGEIVSKEKVRKNREYNYVVKIKEPISQEFFIKAKKKKRINETDLSLAHTEAQQQKKPAILLTNGSLTSKAKEWKKETIGDLVKVIKIE